MKISSAFWNRLVHTMVVANILLVLLNFTLPKTEEIIVLKEFKFQESKGKKNYSDYELFFENFKINTSKNDYYQIISNKEDKIMLLRNKWIKNRAFLVRYNQNGVLKQKIYIGYHCYNSYFIYFIFTAVLAYIFYIIQFKNKDFKSAIPYFSIAISSILSINFLIQFF